MNPFPYTKEENSYELARSGGYTLFIVAIAFSFVPASIISFVIRERESNSKHL